MPDEREEGVKNGEGGKIGREAGEDAGCFPDGAASRLLSMARKDGR